MPETVEEHRDGCWRFRPVPGGAANKLYRCPGCDYHVQPGVPHTLVWPDGDITERRHWHTACWTTQRRRQRLRAADRR